MNRSTTTERSRLRVPAGWALVLVLGVPLLVLTVLAAGYWQFIHYERVAARHVPSGAHSAVRMDLEQVVLFEPIRKRVLPALNQSKGAGTQPARIERIENATGINLAMDMREIVIAFGPAANDWVAVVGGLFPKRTVLAGIAHALSDDAALRVHLSEDAALLELQPWGVFLAQAEDGSLLIASGAGLLSSSLQPGVRYEALGLQREGAGSFGFATEVLPESVRLGLGALGKYERMSGQIVLGDTVELDATLSGESPLNAEAARAQATALLAWAQALAGMMAGTDSMGVRVALARTTVSNSAGNQVAFHTFWDLDDLDRAAERLGTVLGDALD